MYIYEKYFFPIFLALKLQIKVIRVCKIYLVLQLTNERKGEWSDLVLKKSCKGEKRNGQISEL